MLGQNGDIVERCLEGEIWEVGAQQSDLLPNAVGDIDVREVRPDVADEVWNGVDIREVADEVLKKKVEVEVW